MGYFHLYPFLPYFLLFHHQCCSYYYYYYYYFWGCFLHLLCLRYFELAIIFVFFLFCRHFLPPPLFPLFSWKIWIYDCYYSYWKNSIIVYLFFFFLLNFYCLYYLRYYYYYWSYYFSKVFLSVFCSSLDYSFFFTFFTQNFLLPLLL